MLAGSGPNRRESTLRGRLPPPPIAPARSVMRISHFISERIDSRRGRPDHHCAKNLLSQHSHRTNAFISPTSLLVSPMVIEPNHSRKRLHSDITGTSMDHHQKHGYSVQVNSSLQTLHSFPIQLATSPIHEVAPSSPESFIMMNTLERMAFKNVIMSPQEFFMAMLQSRGYPGTTYFSLKCGYHNSPTVSCVCHRVLIVASIR